MQFAYGKSFEGSILSKARMRYWELDFARGIAVILMLVFHTFYDAHYFGKIDLEGFFWYMFPRFIAAVFIFISGVAFALRINSFKKAVKRAAKFAAIAAAITFVTYIFEPKGVVIFGILHFFSLASLFAVFFVSRNNLTLIASIVFLIAGFYLQTQRYDFYEWLWLGFIPKDFYTLDYFPIFPWFGIFLFGMWSSSKMRFKAKYRNDPVSFLGRHSLKIYLIQHPIIILALHLFYGGIIEELLGRV